MRQASFEDDRAKSDNEVAWDDDDDDGSSSAIPEGSGTVPGNNGSEELEGEGETLGHSSKSLRPTSLRDWFEDDDELEPSTVLGATTLHMAAVAAVGGSIPLVVVLLDSPVRQPAKTDPAMLKKPGGEATASRKRSQSASVEPTHKRMKPEPAAKDNLPPKGGKKVIEHKATEVDG
jgi:hypothetical protein